MARTNTAVRKEPELTHGGAVAFQLSPVKALRRSVLSCLLWEDEFYENGVTIAKRIEKLANKVKPKDLAEIALEARLLMHLRHVPLLLLEVLTKTGKGDSDVAYTIENVISRADEMGELIAIHNKLGGKRMLPAQMRKGIAKAFPKFDEYQLAKYNGKNASVKLKTVLQLTHPKPKNKAQKLLWKKVLDGTLETPDTWEVALSGGADKKETFERLIKDGKLGYFALLRNLRNMEQAKVDRTLVRQAILARKGGADKVLPFRFAAAAKAAPEFEEQLDEALLANLSKAPKIAGRTLVVVDVSGSMTQALSRKSDMTRMVAAATLGAVAREVFSDVAVYATAGNDSRRVHATQKVPARRGLALADAICGMCMPLGGGGIFLKQVIDYLKTEEGKADRIIVITDEQDCDSTSRGNPTLAKPFGKHNYLINVASAKNGIGYGAWTHIDGFSENVIRYVAAIESNNSQ